MPQPKPPVSLRSSTGRSKAVYVKPPAPVTKAIATKECRTETVTLTLHTMSSQKITEVKRHIERMVLAELYAEKRITLSIEDISSKDRNNIIQMQSDRVMVKIGE